MTHEPTCRACGKAQDEHALTTDAQGRVVAAVYAADGNTIIICGAQPSQQQTETALTAAQRAEIGEMVELESWLAANAPRAMGLLPRLILHAALGLPAPDWQRDTYDRFGRWLDDYLAAGLFDADNPVIATVRAWIAEARRSEGV